MMDETDLDIPCDEMVSTILSPESRCCAEESELIHEMIMMAAAKEMTNGVSERGAE